MKKSDWLVSLLAGTIFILLSSWYIYLPGLQYDESLCAAPAVNFVVDNPKSEPTQINPSVIHLFGKPLPIMLMSYIGPIKTIAYIPLFFFLDISVITVRLLPILLMFFCFPIIYFICLKLFSRELAFFVVLISAVDPSIVFYLTRDVGPSTFQVLFKLLALMFFIQWASTNKNILLYLGCLILGLGVTHKVDFIWIIIGLSISILLLFFKYLKQKISFKTIFLASLYFAIGAFPIILFNIYTGGFTFQPMTAKFISNNSLDTQSFFNNLITRLEQIIDIHNGNFICNLFCEKNVFTGYLEYVYPILLTYSLVFVSFNFLLKKKSINYSFALGIFLFIIIVTLETCFSPTVLSGHHMLALTPFVTIIICYSVLSTNFIKKFLRYTILLCLTIYLLYSSIYINKTLTETGGTGNWSNSIYELNDYLLKENRSVGVLDWGYTNNLIILSTSRLKIDRLYTSVWFKGDIKTYLKENLNDSTIYIAHSDKYTTFPIVKNAFLLAADEAGYQVILEKVFRQQNGEELHFIYRLKKIL